MALVAYSSQEAFEYWHTGTGSEIFFMISILFFCSAISSAKKMILTITSRWSFRVMSLWKQLRIPLLVFTFANVVLVLAGQF